jgi:hypothetical protein
VDTARSKHHWIALGATLALCVAVLVAMQVVSAQGRRTLPQRQTIQATSAQEAYDAVARAGVRGRTLVLVDATDHLGEFEFPATTKAFRSHETSVAVPSSELVSALIDSGLVRQAFIVYPPDEAESISTRIGQRQFARKVGDYYESRYSGAYVRFSTAFPQLAEKAVVIVNDGISGYDEAALATLTSPDSADLVVRVKRR